MNFAPVEIKARAVRSEVDAPQDQPWGMRALFDPSGVLWRIAQNSCAP